MLELVRSGASPTRASLALNRSPNSVQLKVRELGVPRRFEAPIKFVRGRCLTSTAEIPKQVALRRHSIGDVADWALLTVAFGGIWGAVLAVILGTLANLW